MPLEAGSVLNSGGKKVVVNSSSTNPYVAEGDYFGNGRVTDSTGMSDYTPNIYRQTALMDRFITVGGDDLKYVQGDKETRVGAGDVMIMVGAPEVFNQGVYDEWAKEFAKIAANNLLPEAKIVAVPCIPGVDINEL